MEKLLPLFPLPVVVFPDSPLPLHIFEPRYIEMINECLEKSSEFGVVFYLSRGIKRVGTMVRIQNVIKRFEGGRMNILTIGKKRFKIIDLNEERSFLQARVTFFDDDDLDSPQLSQLLEESNQLLEKYAEISGKPMVRSLINFQEPQLISFFLAELVPYELSWRQRVLELTSCTQRLQMVNGAVGRYLSQLRLAENLKRFFQEDAGFFYIFN
jgi:Lon protease-like protein